MLRSISRQELWDGYQRIQFNSPGNMDETLNTGAFSAVKWRRYLTTSNQLLAGVIVKMQIKDWAEREVQWG